MTTSTFRIDRAIPGTAHSERDTMTSTEARALLYRSLTTTVPKELVHRASVAEVMLTDWERVDDHHFTVAAQWPRGHSFFANVDGHHDPLIVAETIRQVGALLAHAEFHVPLDHHFLMWDLSVSVEQPANLLVDSAPASVVLDISCKDVKRRRNELAGLHYEAVIRRNGQAVATGSATFTCTSAKVYERLRGGRGDSVQQLPLTAPAAPQNVGRTSPMDVVLSPIGEPDRWQLRVDTHHPILFDHPVDHVPGMVLLEAARQASSAVLGRPFLPLGITSAFERYAELDAPCVIEARRLPRTASGNDAVLVTGLQDGVEVFCATMTFATPEH